MIDFFFFKHKTAYEMRISDWSSDVCSSDLMKALAAADDTFMSSTTDLMKDMLFGGTSNLSRHTEMTQPLLEDLCFLPGENTEFFGEGPFRGDRKSGG